MTRRPQVVFLYPPAEFVFDAGAEEFDVVIRVVQAGDVGEGFAALF